MIITDDTSDIWNQKLSSGTVFPHIENLGVKYETQNADFLIFEVGDGGWTERAATLCWTETAQVKKPSSSSTPSLAGG